MKTSSCKAKGRRAAQETKDLLLACNPGLQDDDIFITSSGVTGRDLTFSPTAKGVIGPLAPECKNVEKLNIWDAIKQAHSHRREEGEIPCVFFKRNRSELQVCMSVVDLMRLMAFARGVERAKITMYAETPTDKKC